MVFDTRELTKVKKILENNFVWHVVYFVCCMILTDFAPHPGIILLNMFVLELFSYGLHVLSHVLSRVENPWISWLDLHQRCHHGMSSDRSLWLDLATEVLVPLFLTIVYVIVPVLYFGLSKWAPPVVVLLSVLTYTSYHFVNYTVLKQSTVHRDHHLRGHCNFGPDWLDHAFGTSCTGEVENTNVVSVNLVIITAVLWLFLKLEKLSWCKS